MYTLFFSDVVVSHSTTPQPTSAPSGRSTSTELAISDYVRIPQTKLEFSVISPPDFSRQAYVMLLLLSFFFFFNDLLEQRDLGNYTSIFIKFLRDSRHVHVDVQSGNRFSVSQGRLPWQPILGAKSTEIGDTPSFLGGTRIPQWMAVWKSGWAHYQRRRPVYHPLKFWRMVH